jgi:hypothetical protein
VLADVAKAPVAIEAVRRIDAIFDIEREINGLPAAQRVATRRAQVAPLVTKLERWMRGERGKLSRHADVAKAMCWSRPPLGWAKCSLGSEHWSRTTFGGYC